MRWSGITLVLCINLPLLVIAKSGSGTLKFKQTFQNATVENTKEINLICQVTGPQNGSQYWWLKDGKNIDATKKRFRYKHFRYLKIKNVRKSDAGNYTCSASRNNFTIKHTMYLYVSDNLISPTVDPINNVTAYVGDNVTVTCKAHSHAIPQVQWLIYNKENKNMTVLRSKLEEYKYLTPSGKVIVYEGKLFLTNVSFEDQMKYTCLVGNQYIGYGRKSFFLHVLPRILTAEKSLKFRQTFQNATAENKKGIKLICQVKGPKDSEYWWLKDGKSIDTTKKRFRYKHFRYLKIRNVRKSDAGNYTCLASRNNFTIKHTMYLYVSVPDPKPTEFPMDFLITKPVVKNIHNITVYNGDNVTVLCQAYSYVSPEFAWLIYDKVHKNMSALKPRLKEHEYLPPTSSDTRLHGFKLFLPNVSFEDQIEYTCFAVNQFGYDYKSFFLYVLRRRLVSRTQTTLFPGTPSQTQSTLFTVIKDNNESFRKILIIVPVVAFCVLILVVSLLWVFSVFRKRHNDDASLRHSVDDVGKGDLSAAETKITKS